MQKRVLWLANRNNLPVGYMLSHGPEVLRAIRSKAEKNKPAEKKSYLTVQIGAYGKNSALGIEYCSRLSASGSIQDLWQSWFFL